MGKIYITEKFYNRLEDFISDGIVDKKTFNRLQNRIEELSFLNVNDLKSELHLMYSNDHVFRQRVLENIVFIYLEKESSFYLMDLEVRPKWR